MPPIVAAAAVMAGIGAGVSMYEGNQQAKASKNAANDAANAQAKAIADLQTAQNTASSQAQNALDAKRRAAMSSSDIYTSPLGITGMAQTAQKTLLGQ